MNLALAAEDVFFKLPNPRLMAIQIGITGSHELLPRKRRLPHRRWLIHLRRLAQPLGHHREESAQVFLFAHSQPAIDLH
jgi:hypothetical protein